MKLIFYVIWKLANFEIDEIQENREGIKDYCRNRSETKSLSMINPALDNLRKLLNNKVAKLLKKNILI